MVLESIRIGEAFFSSAQPPPLSKLANEEIGRRIEAEHAAAHKKWNGVEMDIAAFARALGVRCASQSLPFEGSPVLKNATDVYLAAACESGDGAALAAFDQSFLRNVATYVARVRKDESFADEVAQAIRERLFLGGADSRPRIGDYDGAGALAAWVRVVAVNLALNRVRGAGERLAVDDASAVLAAFPASENPELEYIKTRHAHEFREALSGRSAGFPTSSGRSSSSTIPTGKRLPRWAGFSA